MNKTETLWALANPHRFIRLTNALLPFVWASSLILLVVGLGLGIRFHAA